MNKFTISNLPDTNEEKPVLYRVYFSNMYYLHKSKTLKEGLDRFLDDIFRGIRGMKYPEAYLNVVAHCLKYPAMHKVVVEVVLNADPDKILRKEASLYQAMKSDKLSLNNLKIEPYVPEWMIKQSLGKRCDKNACIKSGSINNRKQSFRFCPLCGRLNK